MQAILSVYSILIAWTYIPIFILCYFEYTTVIIIRSENKLLLKLQVWVCMMYVKTGPFIIFSVRFRVCVKKIMKCILGIPICGALMQLGALKTTGSKIHVQNECTTHMVNSQNHLAK